MSKLYSHFSQEVWARGPAFGSNGYLVSEGISSTNIIFNEATNRRLYGPSGHKYPRDLSKGDCTTTCDNFMVVSEHFAGLDAEIRYSSAPQAGNYTEVIYQHSGFPFPNEIPLVGYRGSSVSQDGASDIPEVLDLRRRCLEDFNAKVQKTSSVSGAVFFGELHKTIGMLRSPANSALQLAKQMGDGLSGKSRKFKGAKGSVRWLKEATKVAADLYLEFNFGVTPLVLDINATMDAIRDVTYDHTEKVCHSTRTARFPYYSKTYRTEVGGYAWQEVIVEKSVTSKVIHSAAIASRHQPKLVNLMSQFGVLPSDLPEVWWERIPYSFVVDYFLKINNLFSYSPDAIDRMRYASVTYRDEYVDTYTFRLIPRNMTSVPGETLVFKRNNTGQIHLLGKQVQRKQDDQIGTLILPHLRVPSRHQMLNIAVLLAAFQLR